MPRVEDRRVVDSQSLGWGTLPAPQKTYWGQAETRLETLPPFHRQKQPVFWLEGGVSLRDSMYCIQRESGAAWQRPYYQRPLPSPLVRAFPLPSFLCPKEMPLLQSLGTRFGDIPCPAVTGTHAHKLRNTHMCTHIHIHVCLH